MNKITLNQDAINKFAGDVVKAYAKSHQNECAFCHKPLKASKNAPTGTLPVCDECAAKHLS